MKQSSPGYILVLTLMIISASVILVTRLINRSIGNKRQSRLLLDREKAKMIALGGIEIAISQLSLLDTTTTTTTDQKLITKILENTNRWQNFSLNQAADGIDGELQLYITSESGKINLNTLYNFKDKKFIADNTFDGKKIVQLLAEKLKPTLGDTNFSEILERFLKGHAGPLDDVTELLTLKELKKFHENLFLKPQQKIAVTDLFTVSSPTRELQPLLISASLGSLLGFKTPTQETEKLIKERRELAKNYKAPAQWAQDWNKLLAPLYGKEYTSIPQEIRNLLKPKFEESHFSVVSYGKIGIITQKVYAILEKEKTSDDQHGRYIIKKLYWH